MKHLIYLSFLILTCIACRKDYKCTTTVQRVEDQYELEVTVENHENITKDERDEIEGVERKTYLGMDADYITVCEEQ